jgi:hypothetical protein
VTPPAHGTAAITGNAVLYTPPAGFEGLDAFTYTVGDGRGGFAEGKGGVTVSDSPGRVLVPMLVQGPVDGMMSIEWEAVTNWLYTLEYRDDLTGTQAWLVLQADIPGLTGLLDLSDAGGVPHRFYRVRARLP